jgi:hypothetical protein
MDDAALRPSVLGFLIRARWGEPLLQSLYLLLQLINLLPNAARTMQKWPRASNSFERANDQLIALALPGDRMRVIPN